MQKIDYKPETCDCCHQTTTYLLGLDRGTVDILKKIARFIGRKGINCVHPRKEMEGPLLSSNQVGNLSRARFHGLIAAVRGNKGNYLLTRKGADFLKGGRIPRYAIISKAEKCQVGYFDQETKTCVVDDFMASEDPYWEGINYDVIEGQVIHTLPIQQTLV